MQQTQQEEQIRYPTVTTTDGEAIANDMMAAWNSGTTEDFADIYAQRVVLTTTDDVDADRGLEAVVARATEAQADGFRVEPVGSFTETGQLVAFRRRPRRTRDPTS
jgi:hypothetical protein